MTAAAHCFQTLRAVFLSFCSGRRFFLTLSCFLQTRDILKHVPELKITADLSHWVCVCERTFDEKYDDDWPEILAAVAANCYLIHARVRVLTALADQWRACALYVSNGLL